MLFQDAKYLNINVNIKKNNVNIDFSEKNINCFIILINI